MKEPRYWFPVRPATNGWGWGTPIVWEGWLAYAVFFGALIAGIVLSIEHGALVFALFICAWFALFMGLMFWKGEPQRNRHKGLP
ncbi:MAG TPA: hypothetical protein VFS02_09600 [Telluria sp.]|nr:hypothetical protein [Telluria sp.]